MVLLCVNIKPKLLLPVTDGFAPVEPPHEMSPAEDAELNRPLEGTPQVWPPRETYEPVDGPTDGPQVEGDMCEDETPASLGPARGVMEAGEAEVEEGGESSSHEHMLEEEESESAEPDDLSTTGASETYTQGNMGGREHNTGLEISSSPEVCPTVRSVERFSTAGAFIWTKHVFDSASFTRAGAQTQRDKHAAPVTACAAYLSLAPVLVRAPGLALALRTIGGIERLLRLL